MTKETAMKILKELHHKSLFPERTAIETIIPELKESKDEKIRNALIRFHKSTIDIDGIKGTDILAWLEKQGNNTPTIIWHNIDEKPEEMKELFCEWESDDATWHDVAFYDEESHTFRHAKMPINVTKWVYVDELLEKQGEQKPVIDFKASNWYVSKVDGKIHDITYNSTDKVEPKFKIGDVLCDKSCTTLNKNSQPNIEILDIRDGMYICNNCTFPIEQQDEYELVAKEIEQKPVWSDEDDYNLQCMIAKVTSDIQKGNVGRNNELIDWLKSIKERVQPQPKQEWSEEDKEMLDRIDDSLEAYATKIRSEKDYELEEILKEEQSWLYSLKDRILPQPMQEWSEEDEFRLNRTVENIELLNDANGNILFKDIEWLKSLKDRMKGKEGKK